MKHNNNIENEIEEVVFEKISRKEKRESYDEHNKKKETKHIDKRYVADMLNGIITK